MDEVRIVKSNEDEQVVFGWANVSVDKDGKLVTDLQNDTIDIYDLEKAVYKYVLEYRQGGERHQKKGTGRVVESLVFTPEKIKAMDLDEKAVPLGWWIGFKIDDNKAWEKIKKGEYLMFSIEGKGQRMEIE